MNDLGHLQRTDPAVLDDDPFWSVVRRRHPDIDVVLLSSPEPDGPAPLPETVGIDVVRTVVRAIRDAWEALTPLLPHGGPPGVRWAAADGGHALVIVRSLAAGHDATDLMRRVATALGERGWQLAPERRAGHPVLRATNGLADFEGEAGPGATVLRIATGVLPVSDADRALLLEEVGSWA